MRAVIVFVLCALVCIAADDRYGYGQSQSEDAYCNSTIPVADAVNAEYCWFQKSLKKARKKLNKVLLRGTETLTDIQEENLEYFKERHAEWARQYKEITHELKSHSDVHAVGAFKSAMANFQRNITSIISKTGSSLQGSFSRLRGAFTKYLSFIDEGLSADLTNYYVSVSKDYIAKGYSDDAKKCACKKFRDFIKFSLDQLSAAATCAKSAVAETQVFEAALYSMVNLAKSATWSIYTEIRRCLDSAGAKTNEEIDVCLRLQKDSLCEYAESEVLYANNIAEVAGAKLRLVQQMFGACIVREAKEFVAALNSFNQKFAHCADWLATIAISTSLAGIEFGV